MNKDPLRFAKKIVNIAVGPYGMGYTCEFCNHDITYHKDKIEHDKDCIVLDALKEIEENNQQQYEQQLSLSRALIKKGHIKQCFNKEGSNYHICLNCGKRSENLLTEFSFKHHPECPTNLAYSIVKKHMEKLKAQTKEKNAN